MEAKKTREYHQEIFLLQTYVFLAAIGWRKDTDHDEGRTTVENASRAVRQAEDQIGKKHLIACDFTTGLEGFYSSLEKFHLSNPQEEKVHQRNSNLLTLIRAYIKQRPVQTSDKDLENEIELIHEYANPITVDENGNAIQELLTRASNEKSPTSEQHGDRRQSTTYLKIQSRLRHSKKLSLSQRRKAERGIARLA